MIGFLHPALLAGLAAIAVPVILHFFYRRQLKVVPISTLRFLKMADETLPRQPRLQHLLLLLLRCLLVALLAFFLAKPYFAPSGGAAPVHRLVLLDRSLSMRVKGPEGAPFDQAKKIAGSLVHGLRYQDRVTAFAFDQNPVPVAALDSLQPVARATAPRLALQAVQRYFNEPGAHPEAIVLTDLCSADVPEWIEAKIPGRVVLVQCAINAPANFAITAGRLSAPTATRAGHALAVQVSSSGTQPFDKKIETVVNDQNLGVVTAHSGNGEPVTIEVPLPPAAAGGLWRGSARLLDDDPLPLDNQRYFCFKPDRSDRVYLVDGVPARVRSLSETYYLGVALSTLPDDRVFEVGIGALEQLPWDGLDKLGTILFANVAKFTPDQAAKIAAFVRGGGNAIFTLGDQIDADAYNRVLRTANLLPATLGPIIGEAGRRLETYFLGDIDPGFDGFNVAENASADAFRRCRFYAFYDLQKTDSSSHVLARFQTGQPVLLENSLGTGHVYWFASSIAANWNDFPLHPTYLPFWRNFLSHLAHAGAPPRQFLVGDTAIVKLAGALAPADKLVVLSPTKQPLPSIVTADSVLVANTELPGLYRIVNAAGAERDPGFAVNIPARESLTAPATAADLARLKSAGFEIIPAADAARLTQKLSGDSVPLAVWLALLAVIVATGEWILSNHLSQDGAA